MLKQSKYYKYGSSETYKQQAENREREDFSSIRFIKGQ